MTALPQYGRHVHPHETMRAVVIDRYGPPDVLRVAEVPRPIPRRGQVLVRTRFVGVNPKDVIVRKGKFRILTGKRFPLILGNDIAGEVVEPGPGADLGVGDRVYGMINDASGRAYAEFAAVDCAALALAPQSIDLRESAAVPLAAQTALEALRGHGRLQSGGRVLINGASGGVGVFAVQIAKRLGAHVTAVCSHRNAELVKDLGADEVVDYTVTKPTTLGDRFDVVFDVFGNYRFARMRHLLERRGTYVHTVPSISLARDVLFSMLGSQRARMVVVRSRRDALTWLGDQIDSGRLRVVVERSFALEQAAEAHRLIETKRTRGKIVLEVSSGARMRHRDFFVYAAREDRPQGERAMDDSGDQGGDAGIHIALVSVHGLIRANDLELGCDPDTGGQTLYVVELARALGRRPEVGSVDLLTRRIVDADVDPIYAQQVEMISDRVRIVRIDCGPDEYLRKEELWDHLDAFADNTLSFYRAEDKSPGIIHTHYADAGYVGIRLSSQLAVPLVHTGHSLGRVKRSRLLASGLDQARIEERYHISRRVDAEEDTLAAADRIIVSTENEIDKQYELYDHYQPELMRVIPPGTDMSRFRPPDGTERDSPIYRELLRFLREPDKPIILALSRPDERKNIGALVDAYGGSPELQRAANLVIVAGNRDEIQDMDESSARVISDVLHRIDAHDLYGRVAYPKHHQPDDVPVLYRLAAAHRGVFVNAALTEPFGLTLLEAAASGVPVVATEDGGPREIVANCKNGYLIDPLDLQQIASTLLRVVDSGDSWDEMVEDGLRGVKQHYSWDAHADRYLHELKTVLARSTPRPQPKLQRRPMLYHDRALFSDLDQNLLGDPASLKLFVEVMRRNRKRATFGIATGRRLDSALKIMRQFDIPRPDVLITSVGTEIHYGPEMTPDRAWRRHIDHLWSSETLRALFADVPGLELQPNPQGSRFKLSYYYDPTQGPSPDEITRLLRQNEQTVNTFISFGQYLDIVPVRASKGFALRWFCEHWGIPLNRVLAAGGSGTDEDMMRGNTLAAVVGHRHDEELSDLVQADRIYFAKQSYAAGILEAIEHYDFYETCRSPVTT